MNAIKSVREISREMAKLICPDEVPYFEIIWDQLKERLEKGRIKPSKELNKALLGGLGFTDAQSLEIPLIIGTVSAIISNVLGKKLSDPEKQIEHTIDTYSKEFGLKSRPREILKIHLLPFVKALCSETAGGEIPWKEPQKKLEAEEILSTDFVFEDKLELSWEKNRPCVRVNEEEVPALSEESLFAMLVRMAAERLKNGDGWIDVRDLHDEKARKVARLRKVFSTINLKGIPVQMRREIIKNKGTREYKIALAPNTDNIILRDSLANFVSTHLTEAINKIATFENIQHGDEELKGRDMNDLAKNLGVCFSTLSYNSRLISESLLLVGQKLLDMKWKKISSDILDILKSYES